MVHKKIVNLETGEASIPQNDRVAVEIVPKLQGLKKSFPGKECIYVIMTSADQSPNQQNQKKNSLWRWANLSVMSKASAPNAAETW
jgi:hypothetical protein